MKIPKTLRKILCSEKWFRMVVPLEYSVARLKWTTNRCNNLDDYINLAFRTSYAFPFLRASIAPQQVREEITELLKILANQKSKFILEIGTAEGGTLFLFARVSDVDAVIISVDLPGGQFGGGYPEWRGSLYELFTTHGQRLHLLREDSHALSTFNMVKRILEGHKLDFLFIDGDHSYGGVKMDFEIYSKLVRSGGIIAFHDICPHPPETECEVDKFWREIKDGYEHVEIVKDWKQGWGGIGVLYV